MTKMKSRLKKSAAVMTIVVGSVSASEGVRLVAYKDTIGTGQPWTVCFGETRGVKAGDVYTMDQCKTMLGNALVSYETGMRRCLKTPDKVPDGPYIASLSLSYNIGVAAFCRSSVRKNLDAGNWGKACDSLLLWNRAGGRRVQGLANRRQHERKICLDPKLQTASVSKKIDEIEEGPPAQVPSKPKKRRWRFWL